MLWLFPLTASAQTLTWDANGGTASQVNGSGTWNTINTNWWDGSANVSWVNSIDAVANIGVIGQVTPSVITVASDIQLKELRFMPLVATGAVATANQYTINGDVAGRILDFGTGGLIQMDERSSGGSQFVTLGANLRLKGANLRIQKLTGNTFQYITLGMTANPDLTGTLTIAGSIYATIAAPNTIQSVSRVVVEAGGSAPLGGTNPVYTQPFSLAGFGNSLSFSGTSYGAIRFTTSNTTISGGILLTADAGVHTNFSGANGTTGIVINSAITDGGNNYAFHRFAFTRGDGTLALSAANTYGGATVLGRSGLGGAYSGGITLLDFTAATAPQNDILYNGLVAPGNLSFIGGNSVSVLRLVGKSGDTHSQRLGNVLVNGTHSVLELLPGTGGTMNVSLGTFSRTDIGATLEIKGPSAGSITTTQASGWLGPWASYAAANGTRSWAQVADGVLGNGFAGTLAYTTGQDLSAGPYSATTNLRIGGDSTGALVLGTGSTHLNTLSMADSRQDRLVQAGTGQTLRLGTQSGIQLLAGARNLTVGTPGFTSTLSAGGTVTNTAGQLFLSNHSSASSLTVNSNLANNGTGVVTLIINGAPGSRTILNGTNAHTGGTQVSSGILEVRSNGALGTSGTVTVVDGATLALSGGVTISRALAAIGGFGDGNQGAIRSLSGSNVISGTITQNAMFLIAADAGSTLTIQPPATISYSSILTFGGAGTIHVNSVLPGAGSITKTGNGLLTLNGTNTYTGSTTVNAGTLRLGSAAALGATSGVVITVGGTVDLNGQSTTRNFISMNGTGVGSGGALINSGGTPATITGTAALAGATNIGGSGDIIISNATGLTGNLLLTKIGSGTLTVINSATTSARTGTNQIDAGTLRVQAATAIAPVGTGAYALNGGTLSLGFDATYLMTNVVNVLSNSTIIADRASSGAGGTLLTLSTLTIGGNTLTVKAGDNVTSGTIGLTFGTTTLGAASMRPGNPVFDVQSTANAAMTLTLGAITDQAIAPRTLTFQNSGSAASTVTLGTAGSLVDGTVVNIASTGGALTLNLNIASALGTLARVNVGSGNTLTLGAAQTLGSLAGSGTVSASGAGFALTVGNALSSPALDSSFSGVLANGAGPLSLTKTGKGTLTLDGSTSNTFTGATTVTAGTLVLAKTGGAIALGGSLTIGAAASGTAGKATVRLEGNDQIINTTALAMNGGSTLNLNGFNQTVLTFSSAFGATVTGLGTLAVGQTAGTMTFTGFNTINSNLQLTTGISATRTMAMTSVTDVLTISGSVSQGTTAGGIVAGNAAQTALGTLILTGSNSYTGTTTANSGILNIRHGSALGTITGITSIIAGATLQIQGDITTLAEPLTVRGTGFAGAAGLNFQTGALVNVSGANNYAGLLTLGASTTLSSDSGTLNLTHVGTITGATFGLTRAGAGGGSIASIIGTTTGTVTKNGTGTWTLTGVNTSTGAITINAGILKLGNGSTGRWSTVPSLVYAGSGTFQYAGNAAATTQALGALSLISGAGTLQVDAPGSGTNALTFSSLAAPAVGSGLNIVSPANTSVTLTDATDTNGIVNARLTYNGGDFASSTAGVISAAVTTTATSSLLAGNLVPYLISGSFAQTDSITANAGLKFTGSDTLTINNGILLAINNGIGTAGGILVTGGVAAVIANQGGATGLTTEGSGDLVIRTDMANDSLSIQVPVTSTTTGGLTKNGSGTLTLTAASTYTGVTSINEGTLILANTSAISGSAATVQVGAALNLNGQNITNAATLNGSGIGGAGALINHVGTASIGALTIGFGNGTGGIGASIGGSGNIQSTGVLSGNNLLVKTGGGTLTIGDNGGTALTSTRTGTTRLDAGTLRLSNSPTALGAATAQLVLNGGTLSLGTTASVAAHPTAVSSSSTVIADVFAPGAGLVHTLGILAIGGQTLTIKAGSNVTTEATNAGLTFGATTLTGSPTFDVQSPTAATSGTTTLTLGALNDQGVAKTITFANSGASTTNSLVTLATAAGSLMEGTVVNLNSGPNAGVTLNLNLAAALGTLSQVNVSGNSRLNIGAAQTIASLTGDGTVSASGAFALTVGNANSSPTLSTTFAGTLTNGSGALALTKNGLGTLTLTGTNTYTGATIVSAGILKLGSAAALGATSGVTISAGATLDLNGQTLDRNLSSISGVGHEGNGAVINASATTATLSGTFVQGSTARVGGTGNITINNAGGITGNALLTKFGTGTLTVISAAASARSGTNQIDEGTLRLQAATGFAPIGTGAMALNGGTLSLGFDTSGTVGGVVNLLADSTIIADRASAGSGGVTLTLSTLTIGGNKLIVKAGDNVTSGSIGLTLGTTSLGGPMMLPGNPVFDVQSSASATTTLTLGSLTDQAIAPRTITFQNSGTAASVVTLATTATSLVNGTLVNIASTGGTVTLNVNHATALGTFAQVTVANGNTLSLGASQTLVALNGAGTATASTNVVITIGNPLSPTVSPSVFSGVLASSNLSLVKAGQASLTLSGSSANTYSGSAGTLVSEGTLILAKTGGAVAVPTNLTVDAYGSATGTANVRLEGHQQIVVTATLLLKTGSTFDLNGFNQNLASLGGNDGGTITNTASSTTSTLTVGDGDASSTFVGRITEGAGTLAITKIGTGTLALAGANSHSGTTTVQAGTLQVGINGIGQTGVGAVNLASGSTLLGTGFVQGSSFTAASGSTVYVGESIMQGSYGTLHFTPVSGSGTLDFQAGSTLYLGLNPGGVSDLLNVVGTGTSSLIFSGNLTVTANSFIPTTEQTFNLIDWSGLTSTPTFASHYNHTGTLFGNGDEAAGLDLPDIFGSGYGWDISGFIATGTLSIVLVTEPSRAAFILTAGLAVFLRCSRHRSKF